MLFYSRKSEGAVSLVISGYKIDMDVTWLATMTGNIFVISVLLWSVFIHAILAADSNLVCIPGKYGPSCNEQCDPHCRGDDCHKTTGVCSNGCEDGWFNYQTRTRCHACPAACETCVDSTNCISCKHGHFGLWCENHCSVCRENMCDKLGCLKGCDEGFYQAVTKKIAGLPKENYTECLKCPFEFCATCPSGDVCESCMPNRWGPECSRECPRECERCGKTSGLCCNEREYIDESGQCQRCPDNCTLCNSTSFCATCDVGFSGTTCEVYDCHTLHNCQECKKETTGDSRPYSCTQCLNGYFGEGCEFRCIESCKKGDGPQCDKIDGKCLIGCFKEFWGPFCNNSCGVGCIGSSCDMLNGTCSCDHNYFGHYCNTSCTPQCYDPRNGSQICNISSGDCFFVGPTGIRELLTEVSSKGALTSVIVIAIVVIVIFGILIAALRIYKLRQQPNRGHYASLLPTPLQNICTYIQGIFRR